MKTHIEIFGKSSDTLSVRLTDIINYFKNKKECYWSILWIDGVIMKDEVKNIFSFQSVIDFENSINKSTNGLRISIDDLYKIDLSTQQILNVLLISDKDLINLKRFENDQDMYNSCSTIIELIDGAYWEVSTDNNDFKNNIIENLDGLKIHEN